MPGAERTEEIALFIDPNLEPLQERDVPLYEAIISEIATLWNGGIQIVDIPDDKQPDPNNKIVAIRFSESPGEDTSPLIGQAIFKGLLSESLKLREGLREQGCSDMLVGQMLSSHLRFAANTLRPVVQMEKLLKKEGKRGPR